MQSPALPQVGLCVKRVDYRAHRVLYHRPRHHVHNTPGTCVSPGNSIRSDLFFFSFRFLFIFLRYFFYPFFLISPRLYYIYLSLYFSVLTMVWTRYFLSFSRLYFECVFSHHFIPVSIVSSCFVWVAGWFSWSWSVAGLWLAAGFLVKQLRVDSLFTEEREGEGTERREKDETKSAKKSRAQEMIENVYTNQM